MNHVSSLALRAFAATRAMLALIGFAAVAAYLVLPQAPAPESWLAGMPAITEDVARDSAAAGSTGPLPAEDSPLEREQRAVTEYIAKRYRVSDQAVAGYVLLAYQAGAQYSVDPLLILAVMAIESRYITVGAQILREYQRRFRDTETALQMYGGALDDASTQYASKVLAEKARLDALRVKAKKQTAQSV